MESIRTQVRTEAPNVPGLKVAKAGLWMTLAPVLLDYRTPEGTSWAVPLYTVVLLVSLSGTAMLLHRFGLIAWSRYRTVLAVAAVFFLISVFSGLYWGNPTEAVLRAAPPLLLFTSGLLTVGALMASRLDPRLLWPTVLKASLFGVIIQVLVVQLLVGINLETVRFEILTGAAPMISAFVVTALFFGGWKPWLAFMSILHLSLVMISLTRTHIVVFAAALGFFVAAARERALQASRLAVMFFGVVALAAAVLAIDAALPVSQVGRWVDRMTVGEVAHYGYDITELSRVGEARHQIELLMDSPRGMIFGFGAASPTGIDAETKAVIATILGLKAAEWVGYGIGHNSYIGIFFICGLPAGAALLIMQLWVLTRAFLVTRMLSAREYRYRNRLLLSAPVGYFAYMVYGSLAATLGARSTAMMFAIATGFTLWMYGLLENEIKRLAKEARQRRLRRRLIAG